MLCVGFHACVFYMWHVEFVMYTVRCSMFYVWEKNIPIIVSRKGKEKDG